MSDPAPTSDASKPALAGKEIIVGVCGGIAAYKVADVVSKLVQQGAGVTVAMTDEATRFIAPLTFEALSGRRILVSAHQLQDTSDPQHIKLTERAQLMLVAPATYNVLGKVANGIADDLVTLMIAASACPVVFAPAMNNRMWDHPAMRANLEKLKGFGYGFIGPEAGWLACRNVGLGRMSESAMIVTEVRARLLPPSPGTAVEGRGEGLLR